MTKKLQLKQICTGNYKTIWFNDTLMILFSTEYSQLKVVAKYTQPCRSLHDKPFPNPVQLFTKTIHHQGMLYLTYTYLLWSIFQLPVLNAILTSHAMRFHPDPLWNLLHHKISSYYLQRSLQCQTQLSEAKT